MRGLSPRTGNIGNIENTAGHGWAYCPRSPFLAPDTGNKNREHLDGRCGPVPVFVPAFIRLPKEPGTEKRPLACGFTRDVPDVPDVPGFPPIPTSGTATREITHVPQLAVHNAQISTATVEIKTLAITGKQVTLAVFRQLREEPLVADDGTLNGVPWGTVNYHPDRCADRPEHWHVVWQRGEELLRYAVEVSPRYGLWGSDLLDAFYTLCCAAQLRDDLPEQWFGGKPIPHPGEWISELTWTGTHCGIRAKASARVSVRDTSRHKPTPEALAAMDEDLRRLPARTPLLRRWTGSGSASRRRANRKSRAGSATPTSARPSPTCPSSSLRCEP